MLRYSGYGDVRREFDSTYEEPLEARAARARTVDQPKALAVSLSMIERECRRSAAYSSARV